MSAPSEHSKNSASNFEANTLCPGRPTMAKGLPDRGSKYADEGTAAHTVLGWCIDNDRPAKAYLGRRVPVGMSTWEVTDEMATAVQTAVDNIKSIVGDGMLLSETRVHYHEYLGTPKEDSWGTSDIVALRAVELQVHDYKHGMGVEVDADDNPQMKLYALGSLAIIRSMGEEPETVRLVIHQPRIKSAPSEWTCTVAELEAWGHGEAKRSVNEQDGAARMRTANVMKPGEWERVYLRPNEKSCKFCKAKATCPALRDTATRTVFEVTPASPDEFDSLLPAETPKQSDADWLAKVLSKADLIEGYLTAVRAEVEARLLAGNEIPGFKLVQGKRGNRAWRSADEATETLKGMRLKVEEMYDLKLISPTTAEKLAKAKTIGPRQWKSLQDLITQSDGKKHVAPATDPRPALAVTAAVDDFDAVTADSSLNDFA